MPTNNVVIKSCPKCSSEHSLQVCSQFLALSNEDRLKSLSNCKVCFNCFKPGHYANHCKKSGCKICKRKHNTLIHVSDFNRTATHSRDTGAGHEKPSTSNDEPYAAVTLSCVAKSHSGDYVLLSTALITVYDNNNRPQIARAILDSGSTSCLITESLSQKLNLPIHKVSKSLLGINNSLSNIGKMVHVPMSSLNGNYSNKLFCFVLPYITEHVPSRQISLSCLNIPSDICLADPSFHTPSAVDIIIGADVFWDLLGSRRIRLGDGSPVLYETGLGWLVSGPIHNDYLLNSSQRITCNFGQLDSSNKLLNDDIQIQLTRFWQLEEVSHKSSYYSNEEQSCEDHFIANTTRLQDGRFCVRIPINQNPNVLGNSFPRAKQCLLSLERRTKCNPSFRKSYCDFMSEYVSLGHMSECHFKPETLAYFIPHHGVLRESSTTTKLRVVFNASAPTSSGVSLNGIQMVGPTIQDNLLSILLRFRQHKFILAADIEKMYRQIAVHPDDRYLQQILWRENCLDPIKTYQLNTVTYGTASAPFLAVRCLKQLALECVDPEIAHIITHDFYVDDLITGGDTIAEVVNIKEKVTSTLASACMPLRKFKSNAPELVIDPKLSLNLNIGSQELDKTLGLGWHTESDELRFSINANSSSNVTKRSILSSIGQIFDPMGLLSPCIISMKIILQKLWLCRVSWDDDLPPEITQSWCRIIRNLPLLNDLHIPRLALCNSPTLIELHIFTDASQDAYGACAYLKSSNDIGDILVRLILAKSRVAPIKPTTIPRLELCGALVGARLYEKLSKSLRINIDRTYLWTDSMIVLGWLKMLPSKLQPFVRNRVADIHEITNRCTWNHVSTDSNPADLISRGVELNIVQTSQLWWCGPKFLRSDASYWPSKTSSLDILPEVKPEVALIAKMENKLNLVDFTRFSNFLRLKRSLAYVLRFISRCKKQAIETKHLNDKELQIALNLLVRISQSESFPEYQLLLTGSNLNKKSPLIKFNVFLDDKNLIRVGGRLENSNFTYNKKHPLIIQSTHPFTKLLFQYEHKRLMHAAPQLLLATIREQFWPIGGRTLAKLCFRQCILCKRMRGKITAPMMGNLPTERLSSSYPFETVGIDYAGPILAANRSGRGCKLVKVYIAIFICFTTKAIHIELVGDLTSNSFLSSLRRFISRRGKPKNIFSDNGTSFVGAYNEIGKFLKSNCHSLSEDAANEGIKFHFTPPYTPHFGGLWEAGVKSIKYHLSRVLGNCHLTYEELNTVLIQIEGLLNSRPLTALSTDPNDLLPLTPAHFLIGRPLTSLPTPNYAEYITSRLSRYQRIEQLRQHFWNRWSKEFIAELQQRVKWQSKTCDLKLDSLVVLKEDFLPPMKWKLGRIIAVYPGQDGINRVADVKTANGVVRRTFSKICPLLQDNQEG